MASRTSQQYGSQPSAIEVVEDQTPTEYSPQRSDEPQFVSFVSPESPDGVGEITSNITGEPIGNLQLGGSALYKRRIDAKPTIDSKCFGNNECDFGLEGRTEAPVSSRKRVRGGPHEDIKKGKKIKVHSENDQTNEGQSGFAHLNEFLSNIQYLNDGTLNFELDVSYDHFKLKVEYSFE